MTKISREFLKENKPNHSYSKFFKAQGNKIEKNWPNSFKFQSISILTIYLQPKELVEQFKTKLDIYFWISTDLNVFWLFKVT